MAFKNSDLPSVLQRVGVDISGLKGDDLKVFSPNDGEHLLSLRTDKALDVENKIKNAVTAFGAWRETPAPLRGELIRLFGEELRSHKEALAELVTIECGKILAEGLGEVQEMIDICDFALGLSRQIYGLTIASERPRHVMQETWHPLGVIAVISAFNFPVAVWAWNFALALVGGNSVVWKPSEKTPLCALACQALFSKALMRFEALGHKAPNHLSQVVIGEKEAGASLVDNRAVALVSATGSTQMGSVIGPRVASRFGRSLLELGGNNAVIVSEKADQELARNAILFGAVGTAGQRCTTTRRAIIHKSIFDKFASSLESAYRLIIDKKIGHPLDPNTLIGPLIDKGAFDHMQDALKIASDEGGTVLFGNRMEGTGSDDAYYVAPALVRMPKQTSVVCREVFAPILYLIPYEDLEEAIALNNSVPQGLASAIFTTDLREAERFRQNSDCGITNVNIGTSGAEIGGAFGGEKETGGGRESGTDSWKNYMRRQTSTLYYGTEKPELAQGIVFDVL